MQYTHINGYYVHMCPDKYQHIDYQPTGWPIAYAYAAFIFSTQRLAMVA